MLKPKSFVEWLSYHPFWEKKLDQLPNYVFEELGMSKERIEHLFEKLDEYDFFDSE